VLLVKWRPQALESLVDIIDYIEQYNVTAANKLHSVIVEATESLSAMPYSYPKGRLAGTREMVVHPNYIVVYRVNDSIDVIQVLHARQKYPEADYPQA